MNKLPTVGHRNAFTQNLHDEYYEKRGTTDKTKHKPSMLPPAFGIDESRQTNAAKLFQAALSFLDSFLKNSVHSNIFLICGPIKASAFIFASESLEKKFCKYLNASEFLSKALTNFLMRPNFMCNGGINILLISIKRFPFGVVLFNRKFVFFWQCSPMVVHISVSAIPIAKVAWKFCKSTLETH